MMISSFRDALSSWPIRILLFALVMSFVTFYGWQAGQSVDPGVVAKVNGKSIMVQDVQMQMQNMIRTYQSMGLFKGDVPPAMLRMLQDNVVKSLISQELQSSEAQRLGLYGSKQVVAKQIRTMFSQDGKFDAKRYNDVVRYQLGKTKGAFETDLLESAHAQVLSTLIRESSYVPEAELKAGFQLQNEKVNFEFVRLNVFHQKDLLPKVAEPTEEDLQTYFKDHMATYAIPEKKKLKILWMEKDKDQSAEAFQTRATKRLDALRLNLTSENIDTVAETESLKAFESEFVAAGATIANFPHARDMGVIQSQIRTLPLDAASDPVLNFAKDRAYLVYAKAIKPSEDATFEDVKTKVRQDWAQEKEKENLKTFAQNLLKEADAAKDFSAFMKKKDIPLEETGFFAASVGNSIPALGQVPGFVSKAFAVEASGEVYPEVVYVFDDAVILSLKAREEPDWTVFEKEKAELQKLAIEDYQTERLMAYTDHLQDTAEIEEMPVTFQ